MPLVNNTYRPDDSYLNSLNAFTAGSKPQSNWTGGIWTPGYRTGNKLTGVIDNVFSRMGTVSSQAVTNSINSSTPTFDPAASPLLSSMLYQGETGTQGNPDATAYLTSLVRGGQNAPLSLAEQNLSASGQRVIDQGLKANASKMYRSGNTARLVAGNDFTVNSMNNLLEALAQLRLAGMDRGISASTALQNQDKTNAATNLGLLEMLRGETKTGSEQTNKVEVDQGKGAERTFGLLGKLFGCWVAREVYGIKDNNWKLFRYWMLNKGPVWFKYSYLIFGKLLARLIRNRPTIKAEIRVWMDSKIETLKLSECQKALTQEEVI